MTPSKNTHLRRPGNGSGFRTLTLPLRLHPAERGPPGTGWDFIVTVPAGNPRLTQVGRFEGFSQGPPPQKGWRGGEQGRLCTGAGRGAVSTSRTEKSSGGGTRGDLCRVRGEGQAAGAAVFGERVQPPCLSQGKAEEQGP